MWVSMIERLEQIEDELKSLGYGAYAQSIQAVLEVLHGLRRVKSTESLELAIGALKDTTTRLRHAADKLIADAEIYEKHIKALEEIKEELWQVRH